MTTLPLKTSEGHFVITLEGKNFVIDTGSPISFSCDYTVSHIDIGESHFRLTPFNSRKMAMELENLVKMPVSGIIGMDTLKELKRMEISKEEGYIKFMLRILSDEDTGEDDSGLVIDEVNKLKGIIINKYKEYLTESEYKALLTKLILLEEEFQKNYNQKMYMNYVSNIYYEETDTKGRGR